MLVIRMQRTGRKGHAMFRVVVQDSRRTPTSGKIVAQLGSYDPHTKQVIINKDKAAYYMEHGAQPSERVARLLKAESVKLPNWVELSATKKRTVRNAEKRRSTSPAAPVMPEEAPKPQASQAEPEDVVEDTATETSPETPTEATPEAVPDTPAEATPDESAETPPDAQPETPAAEASASSDADAEQVAEPDASPETKPEAEAPEEAPKVK